MDEEKNESMQDHKEQQETMEVTMATQSEDVSVAAEGVGMSSETQRQLNEMGDVPTLPSPVKLPLDSPTEGRDEDDDEDSDSDSSSSSSSSSSPAPVSVEDESFTQPAPVKTRDEVLLEELPAVEEVSITLPEDVELLPVGTVSNIIQQLVIIQSLKDMPPLTDDSIIFTSDRVSLAKVFEVFGPVSSPLYILRFNSVEQISSKGLREGLSVYYAPAIKEYTGYIFVKQLKLLEGSDASWKNDHEPPAEALDYSDDEKEHDAKRKIKRSKKVNNNTDNPARNTQNTLQQCDTKHFPPRHAGAQFRHQNPRNKQQPLRNAQAPPRQIRPPSRHSNVLPGYLPPPCPYPPPPFPLANFPLYPPPPPSFFNSAFSSHHWPPAPVSFPNFPPPPPPPPQ
ncbi:H/ACA ribonucleoprotein complex non-core subunit NAF1 [Brachionichthys hirsutus]|uniref:H/ACA ribonucleoprotein complex non-core subunit NAF1 n=1 Tax=Brachionichthys hirsutus TaxID=412623 RepID=UPI0036044624